MTPAPQWLLSQCPRQLSFILPFLQRASELDSQQPCMSYYCIYYAVGLAMKSSNVRYQRTPETDAFLSKLFDRLELQKQELADQAAITHANQGAIYVREMAYRLFLCAEKAESAAADANTTTLLQKALQNYLISIQFLQVYRGIFLDDEASPSDEEARRQEIAQVEEKSKYAKWRVIELKKRISAGLSNPPPCKSHESPPVTAVAANATTANTSANASAASSPAIHPPPVDPKIVAECEKHARYAISALHFDDLPNALQNLQAAMDIIAPLVKK